MGSRPNPYDRRGQALAPDGMLGWTSGQVERLPSVITLDDLEVLARSVASRVRQEADLDAQQRFDQQLQDVQRRAWDEGYDAGARDAREQLLAQLARRYEDPIKSILEDTGANHGRFEAALALLQELLEAHHAGFPEAEHE